MGALAKVAVGVVFGAVVAGVLWALWIDGRPVQEGSMAGAESGEAGVAVEPAVERGELAMEVRAPVAAEVAVTSPAREVVAVEAPVVEPPIDEAGPPRIVGRAVDASGEPLARARLRAVLRGFDWMPVDFLAAPVTTVRADRDGRFEWTPEVALDQRWEAVLRARVKRREHVATFVVEPMESGTLDVGDVRFELPPLVVSGRLVDDAGQPVERASLRVVAVSGARTGLYATSVQIEDGVEDGGVIDVRQFPAFEPPEGARLELHVEAHGYADAVVPFEVGGDVGNVVVARQGAIEGRVVVDPEWKSPALLVRVRRLDGELAAPERIGGLDSSDPRRAEVQRDGRFRFADLPTGRYDLSLEGGAWVGPYVPLWSDVGVTAGAAPVELGTRDVGGLVARTIVRVRGVDGEPVEMLPMQRELGPPEALHFHGHGMRAREGGEFHFFHGTAGGTVTLLPHDAMRVVVACDGGEHDVALRPAPLVRLRLHGVERLPERDFTSFTASRVGTGAIAELAEADDGTWTFAAPEAGAWVIHASLDDFPPSDETHLDAVVGTIDVLDTTGEHVFELTLPEELLATGD